MNSKSKNNILSIAAKIIIITSLFSLAGYINIKDAKDDWFIAYNIDYNRNFDILLSSLDNRFIEAGIISASATSIASVASLNNVARDGIEAVNDRINVKFSQTNEISNIILTDKKVMFRSYDFSKSDFYIRKIIKEYNDEVKNYVNRTLSIYEDLLNGYIDNQKENKLNDLREFIKINKIGGGLTLLSQQNYFTTQSLNKGYWHFLDDNQKKTLIEADKIVKNAKPFLKKFKSPALVKLEEIFREMYSSNDLTFQNMDLDPERILIVADYLLSVKYLSKNEKIYSSIEDMKKKLMKLDLVELLELNQANNSKPPIFFSVLSFAITGLVISILFIILTSKNSRSSVTKKLTALLHQVQKS